MFSTRDTMKIKAVTAYSGLRIGGKTFAGYFLVFQNKWLNR